MEKENITNEQLADLINKRMGSFSDEMSGLRGEIKSIKSDLDILKEGAFTKDEKEDILGIVKNFNERLENETLGKDNITFTRGEYDDVSKNIGFENRFAKTV